MKIVHIITGLGNGGAEGVLYRLCLNSTNTKHIVISLIDMGKYGHMLKENEIEVHCLHMNRFFHAFAVPFRLFAILKKERPEAVQCWMYHADLIGGVISKFANVKKIFWGIRNTEFNLDYSSKLTILIAKVCAKLSFIPNKIVCCAYNAKESHFKMGYVRDKMAVIHNGYDLEQFKPDEKAGILIRNELNIPRDNLVLGMVGRYHLQKDHENLFKAMSKFIGSNSKVTLVLVGNGLDRYNLNLVNTIEKYGLSRYVRLLGPRNDVPAIMNSLDMHILSSRVEGFPNVLAEAMACGTVCISTDVGDAKYIVLDERFVCPPHSPQELLERINFVVDIWESDKKQFKQLKALSSLKVKRNFTVESMVSKYEKIWSD